MRASAVAFLLLALLASPLDGLGAQEAEPLRFDVVPGTGEAQVEILDLFSDPSLVDAVLSGLPLRIRLQVQLWKDGFFDNQEGLFEWRASIVFDPLTRRFRVQTSERTESEKEVNTLADAQRALQLTLDIPLRPREPGRYYYIAVVAMETLSLSDLEELQRWLKGDLASVVAGDRDVEGALARGFRRIFVRMLGLPAKRFQVESPRFRIEGGGRGGEEGRPAPPLGPFRPASSIAGR